MSEEIYLDEKLIQQRIQAAFKELGESERVSFDISFHMTDWISDIKELLKVYSNIENLSNDEIRSFVYKFVAHVPNHLNAAMKLSGINKVEDVFNAGIFEDE